MICGHFAMQRIPPMLSSLDHSPIQPGLPAQASARVAVANKSKKQSLI